jgi:hypothetical protein
VTDRVAEYLLIPKDYGLWLGGLRWSASGEAVEYEDGETFVLRQQVALFLEGLASEWRPIHFAHVLHLLHLLGHGKLRMSADTQALCCQFQQTGRPLRNAGALCAVLCHEVAAVAGPLDVGEVRRLLSHSALMWKVCLRWAQVRHQGEVEVPPLGPEGFEAKVVAALAGFTQDELAHWLRYGRGPLPGGGEPLAEEVLRERPRTLPGLLAALVQHERLAGAVPFVAQLVSALSLPPRRLALHELPMGGYADVATRGHPEQLLPSQFAVEDVEFVRRYAENELLYFRREEPHARVREDLVVLLDQGVRTWGDVRLMLAAAVFALGKLAVRRKLPIRLAATSAEGAVIDPLEANEQAVAELLAASDLSPHPGLALERVLEEPTEAARDVVLLTHPRNLAEADVQAAARRAVAETRLFALAVDDHGKAEFSEVKHGTAVPLSRFAVRAAEVPRRTRTPLPPEDPLSPWQGPVEPFGFPFRFGLTTQVDHLAFDHTGEWLLTASQNGMLHAWRVDGSQAEVLPRGMDSGCVLKNIHTIVGVSGGFVVTARQGNRVVFLHYDLAQRTCLRLPLLGELPCEARYFPGLRCIAVNYEAGAEGYDFADGTFWSGTLPRDTGSRAERACAVARRWHRQFPRLCSVPGCLHDHSGVPYVQFDQVTGTLSVRNATMEWWPFTPLADGKPELRGWDLREAQWARHTLAVRFRRGVDHGAREVIKLFRGPEGIPLETFAVPYRRWGFILSNDGLRLARHSARAQVTVHDVGTPGPPVFETPLGGYHSDLSVELGTTWMRLQAGGHGHLLSWEAGLLQTGDHRAGLASPFSGAVPNPEGRGVSVAYWRCVSCTAYDRDRFPGTARALLNVVVDSFGQVAVFDRAEALVCMLFVFRNNLAGWMPDGTRFGPPSITGGPETPDFRQKFGKALWEATERGRRAGA